MRKRPHPTRFYRPFWLFILSSLLLLTAGCQRDLPLSSPAHIPTLLPRASTVIPKATVRLAPSAVVQTPLSHPDHVVIVIEENHSYDEIIGSASAPYINSLAKQGALFTDSHGVSHPSEPNYLALFSGSTQGVESDACPLTFSGPNLETEFAQANLSFGGYSENMPGVGYIGCFSPSTALYARKHNPWVNFTNVPDSVNMPWTSFPTNYNTLPTISIVVPNQLNDMHSAPIPQADTWLKNSLAGYAQWTNTHNSLLIVTWDEDDFSASNHIPTIFVGQMVKPGQYSTPINHYNVLRTLEALYGLPSINNAGKVSAITNIWRYEGSLVCSPDSNSSWTQ